MKFEIVNIDEFSGEMAQIYSIMLDGDDMTLMDHFFEDNSQFREELILLNLRYECKEKKGVGRYD